MLQVQDHIALKDSTVVKRVKRSSRWSKAGISKGERGLRAMGD